KMCKVDSDCLSGNCNTTCQPCATTMVAVSTAGGNYCIDALETTQSQYAAFLATNPSLTGQISQCTWNQSYSPDPSGTGCYYDPTGRPLYPVVCVDWCDAYAYCKSVGKRLCGKIGGGPNDFTAQNDAAHDEWYRACSAA